MELSESPQKHPKEYGSARDSETPVFMFIRLWTYGGSSQPLSRLPLEQEPEVAELVGSVIREGKGVILEPQRPGLFSALFNGALIAVSTAKGLQQRFLSYHRKTDPHQIVPCVLISGVNDSASSGLGAEDSAIVPEHMLGNANSARILICQSVYERVKSAPGFQFDPKPVREPGQTGDPEAIYELLWTDESTYGHLRTAARSQFHSVGRYQVQEELGRGAMGAVYKAYDPLIGRTVALKIISIDRNTPDRDQVIERLKQEAKAAGKLDHPNIITIYDVGEEDDLVYLSMQFLEGKTLQTMLAESGVPQLSTLISWADQICSAVGYAHAHGVIHRDLKPANLMLSNQGVIKILDFGIAKVEDTTLTETGLVVGTPSHMAPEQVAGKKVDQRTDIFALGSVYYELVTREKPFRGDIATVLYKIVNEDPVAPSLINPALPGGMDAIIRKALAKDPKDRFQTCDEMRKAFLEQATLLNTRPAAGPADPTAAKATPQPAATFSVHLLEDTAPQRSARIWPAVAGVLAVALIGIAGWGFYTWSHTGSLPAIMNRAAAVVHRLSRQASDGLKHAGKTAEPSSARTSDQSSRNGARDSGASAGASSPPQVRSTETKAQASPEKSGTSNLTSQPSATTQTSSQPVVDGAPASPPAGTTTSTKDSPLGTPLSGAPDQAVSTTSPDSTQQKDESQPPTASGSSGPNIPAEGQPAEAASAAKPLRKLRREPAAIVDGFTRRDVPELLRQADAAEGRGDYSVARYSYNLILKLDPGNTAARSGLHRLAAQQPD